MVVVNSEAEVLVRNLLDEQVPDMRAEIIRDGISTGVGPLAVRSHVENGSIPKFDGNFLNASITVRPDNGASEATGYMPHLTIGDNALRAGSVELRIETPAPLASEPWNVIPANGDIDLSHIKTFL